MTSRHSSIGRLSTPPQRRAGHYNSGRTSAGREADDAHVLLRRRKHISRKSSRRRPSDGVTAPQSEKSQVSFPPKEYWGEWTCRQLPPHVHIEGTKRARRVRDVPLWAGVLRGPVRSRSAFRAAWDRHLGDKFGIYDLRRSFAVWMEDAGIPRSRRKLYLGHSAGDVTGFVRAARVDRLAGGGCCQTAGLRRGRARSDKRGGQRAKAGRGSLKR